MGSAGHVEITARGVLSTLIIKTDTNRNNIIKLTH